jgi:hypothetical protein
MAEDRQHNRINSLGEDIEGTDDAGRWRVLPGSALAEHEKDDVDIGIHIDQE